MTIAANGDIEQLKQECADLIPNVSRLLSPHAVLIYTCTCSCVRCGVLVDREVLICVFLNFQTLLPYEWVYGIMFRACEEAQSPEFGLQLWKGTY